MTSDHAEPRRRPSRLAASVLGAGLAVLTLLSPALRAAAASPQAAATTADSETALDHLFTLVQQRLDLAEPVARAKWNSHAPIEDPERERQVIDDVAGSAATQGLDPQFARVFFRAQIEASKVIQRALHADWTARQQPPFATVADLAVDVRPQLDRLTPALLQALSEASGSLGTAPSGSRLAAAIATAGDRPGRAEALRVALQPLLERAGR